jgi:lipid II:glycine glycyltransferase (peptidoglycan interpeptide bridge formation enzyme)
MINRYYFEHPMQSPEWGQFRSEWGNKVVKVNNQQITFSKIPHTPFTIGTVFKGPMPTTDDIKQLREIGKRERAIFIKLEPNVTVSEKRIVQSAKEIQKIGLVQGKRFFTPTTFVIDLTKDEEELLKSFTSKTRYNIRLAQKHGVVVHEDNSPMAFAKYLELTFATAKRQNFFAHTRHYHDLMWKHLHPKIAHLLTATYNPPSPEAPEGQGGKIISAWILFVYDKTLYYPYGASSTEHKEVMANNLMMWEAIRFGKKHGCTSFDLWGREEGRGFTKFKEGYNPQVVEFIGSWDLVLNQPLYYLYRIAEKIRWLILKHV